MNFRPWYKPSLQPDTASAIKRARKAENLFLAEKFEELRDVQKNRMLLPTKIEVLENFNDNTMHGFQSLKDLLKT